MKMERMKKKRRKPMMKFKPSRLKTTVLMRVKSSLTAAVTRLQSQCKESQRREKRIKRIKGREKEKMDSTFNLPMHPLMYRFVHFACV